MRQFESSLVVSKGGNKNKPCTGAKREGLLRNILRGECPGGPQAERTKTHRWGLYSW